MVVRDLTEDRASLQARPRGYENPTRRWRYGLSKGYKAIVKQRPLCTCSLSHNNV